tara:strand:- start:208 stop:594 length:387 start_codon:yes stop_codon:yes gene_type:complete
MEILNNNSIPNKIYQNLGNRKRYKKPKSELRLFIEAIVMIFTGINLILFLNSIPDKFIWNEFVNESWVNILNGVLQLIDALMTIGTATSVVFLILFSLFLITGGSIRMIRVIQKSIKKHKGNNHLNLF